MITRYVIQGMAWDQGSHSATSQGPDFAQGTSDWSKREGLGDLDDVLDRNMNIVFVEFACRGKLIMNFMSHLDWVMPRLLGDISSDLHVCVIPGARSVQSILETLVTS